jgi:hypothetical protein
MRHEVSQATPGTTPSRAEPVEAVAVFGDPLGLAVGLDLEQVRTHPDEVPLPAVDDPEGARRFAQEVSALLAALPATERAVAKGLGTVILRLANLHPGLAAQLVCAAIKDRTRPIGSPVTILPEVLNQVAPVPFFREVATILLAQRLAGADRGEPDPEQAGVLAWQRLKP